MRSGMSLLACVLGAVFAGCAKVQSNSFVFNTPRVGKRSPGGQKGNDVIMTQQKKQLEKSTQTNTTVAEIKQEEGPRTVFMDIVLATTMHELHVAL